MCRTLSNSNIVLTVSLSVLFCLCLEYLSSISLEILNNANFSKPTTPPTVTHNFKSNYFHCPTHCTNDSSITTIAATYVARYYHATLHLTPPRPRSRILKLRHSPNLITSTTLFLLLLAAVYYSFRHIFGTGCRRWVRTLRQKPKPKRSLYGCGELAR